MVYNTNELSGLFNELKNKTGDRENILLSFNLSGNNPIYFSPKNTLSENLKTMDKHRKNESGIIFVLESFYKIYGLTSLLAEIYENSAMTEKNMNLKKDLLRRAGELNEILGEYNTASQIYARISTAFKDRNYGRRGLAVHNNAVGKEGEIEKKAMDNLKGNKRYVNEYDLEIKEAIRDLEKAWQFKKEKTWGMARHYYGDAMSILRKKLEFLKNEKGKENEMNKVKGYMIDACSGEADCYIKMGLDKNALKCSVRDMPDCREKEFMEKEVGKTLELIEEFRFDEIRRKGEEETPEPEVKQGKEDEQKNGKGLPGIITRDFE